MKALEEEIKVVEVSNVDELVGEGRLSVIIVMSRDITLKIILF
jgi:hypothetical protein